MIRNIELYKQAETLRRKGESYLRISKILHISKSTLSDWFSHKGWSRSIKLQLAEKHKEESRNQLTQLNLLRRIKTLKRYESYREEAGSEYVKMKENPLFAVGLSIYWGEGEKTANNRVGVINTDPDMLQVIVGFYRRVLKVPESKLRAALFLYDDINEAIALSYWSKKINLSKGQFIKTQNLKSRSVLTRRRVINGICNVYFCDTKLNIKIREWIRLLASEMRV